ncbi:NifU family protein [Streptomyces mexicanus]|uniref:NifU family protein n=1 Tax=Streptomyces mexicanus TaxID=178566 RepID=A0A7X1LSR5_9ACTN|nr:NifU family protein [Streptomyces mexicanus]MBC2868044.1 NifU family protein [Streptomyces mexicanus]
MNGGSSAPVVPMHPEAGADPQTVRWVIPAGTLPVVGRMTEAPDELGAMLHSGDIASIEVETRAVVIRLADGRSWSALGAQVRDALSTALRHPEQWRPADEVTEDDLLRAALQDVLAGPAGDYIRSHGGEVTIVSAHDRRAEVRMAGTCTHCPAAGFTLHSRLESELRTRFPDLVELRATEESAKAPRGTWLTVRRRRTPS